MTKGNSLVGIYSKKISVLINNRILLATWVVVPFHPKILAVILTVMTHQEWAARVRVSTYRLEFTAITKNSNMYVQLRVDISISC